MSELLFGTAGIPHSAKKGSSVSGVERIKELSLGAMEVEFVYGVRMKEAEAKRVLEVKKECDVLLSVHAPYFINLNSYEKKKVKASQQRILQSLKIGNVFEADIVVFHPGFYQKSTKEEAYKNVRENLGEVSEKVKELGIKTRIGLETTGKGSQFGDLEEVCRLANEFGNVWPVIDFSHLHARCNGCLKKKEDFEKILETVEKADRKFLKQQHMHISGINYTEKGERNHLNMNDKGNDFDYKAVLRALKNFKAGGTVICESPNLERDALLMQKYYKKI